MDYYVESGVRRCVAAPELGLTHMVARLHEAGQPPAALVVPLAELHSPKTAILDDQRYRDVFQALSTTQGRAGIAKYSPIDLQILGSDPSQAPTVPLKDVQLLPETP